GDHAVARVIGMHLVGHVPSTPSVSSSTSCTYAVPYHAGHAQVLDGPSDALLQQLHESPAGRAGAVPQAVAERDDGSLARGPRHVARASGAEQRKQEGDAGNGHRPPAHHQLLQAAGMPKGWSTDTASMATMRPSTILYTSNSSRDIAWKASLSTC